MKVNQQRHIVEEVVEFGAPWRFGLEAGSKPELLIALAHARKSGGLILCNGYKDEKYIETALLAQRFDKTVFIVLERLEELDMVFRASEKLGIAPALGVRAKLTAKGVGRWKDSAGDRAKFGLTTSEIVEVVDRLGQKNLLSSLQLLHFHIGSQVSSIIPIKNAIAEAANIYVDLAKMGASMRYLDVGGGLAVDYDGSKTDFHASKNYNIQEYANDIVSGILDACTKANVAVPTIVTESGRAVTAHQSVLVFEVVGTNDVRFGDPRAAAAQLARRSPRALRHVEERRAQERAGGMARRQPGEGGGAEPLQVRLRRSPGARAGREALLELLREDPPDRAAHALRSRRAARSRARARRHLLLQLLRYSSRRRIRGPSTSSFPSCPFTGSTRSRPCGRRSPISPATATAPSTTSSIART